MDEDRTVAVARDPTVESGDGFVGVSRSVK